MYQVLPEEPQPESTVTTAVSYRHHGDGYDAVVPYEGSLTNGTTFKHDGVYIGDIPVITPFIYEPPIPETPKPAVVPETHIHIHINKDTELDSISDDDWEAFHRVLKVLTRQPFKIENKDEQS